MSQVKTGEHCPQNMDKKVSSLKWTILKIIVYYFSLFQPWRKKAFLPSAKSKDNLLFGILNPLRPLFLFDHPPHSY